MSSRKYAPNPIRQNRSTRGSGAFSLVETLVASVVILTALGAIFLVSSRCIGIVKTGQDIAVGSAMLSERMLQLQATDWEDLTDSDAYTNQVWTDPEDGTTENVDGLLKNATQSGNELRRQGVVESVRVSAYRATASATPVPAPITVSRTTNGATLTSGATNLVDEKTVRIDLRLTWTDGRMGIPRSLALSSLVSRK